METQRQYAVRRAEWLPVWLAGGIMAYCFLPFEPPALWLLIAPTALALLVFYRYCPPGHNKPVTRLLGVFLVTCIGFSAAQWQVMRLEAPVMEGERFYVTLEGVVEEVSLDSGRARLLIAVDTIEELPPDQTPRKVRLSVRGKGDVPQAGGRIRVRAGIFRPSAPHIPGGFDFARYFYFREIGGIGYILPPIERLENAAKAGPDSRIARWRQGLQGWLLGQMPQPEGGVAVALLTGDQTAVDETVADEMRISSLAHILSISGMHMAIICGLFFFWLRTILILIPCVADRYDVKKISAVFGMLLGGFYLLLSGMPISAIRAWLMISVFFLAVLLDREAVTLRSLALAAILVLVLIPSSLFEAGFQLSFAATAALIVCYRRLALSPAAIWAYERPWYWKAVIYFPGLAFSSLIASAATAPFIAYHFHQFNLYGILANMLALPVLSFIVMPALALAVLLYPLGLSGIMLALVKWGIGWLIGAAHLVAALPGSSFRVPPMESWTLFAIGLGFILLILGKRHWQCVAGAGVFGAALASLLFYQPPDVLADETKRYVALRTDEEEWVLLRGKSARNFTVRQWEEYMGIKILPLRQWEKKYGHGIADESACPGQGPFSTVEHSLLVNEAKSLRRKRQATESIAPECPAFTFKNYTVIAPEHGEITVCRKGAPSCLTSAEEAALKQGGALSIRLGDGEIEVKSSCAKAVNRPWSGCGKL